MLGMNEPSQLYEESNDVQMDLMPGKSDLLQMQVGSGSREPSPNPPHRSPATARPGRPNGGRGGPANGGAPGGQRPCYPAQLWGVARPDRQPWLGEGGGGGRGYDEKD